MTSIIIMCRQDRDILSFVTCRRGSYEYNMIFRVMVGTLDRKLSLNMDQHDDLTVKLMSLQPHLQYFPIG
jgi:hypothetical protein